MGAKNQLVEVHNNLEKLLNSKRKALPKHFNQTRFLQNCMTVLQDTPDIASVTPVSIARTMLKGAFLGLDFFQKECYAIPYKKNIGTKQSPNYVKELQFQTDYKGEIKVVKRFSPRKIREIYAKIVRKSDVFEEKIVNGQQVINFAPQPFNDREIVGAFAVCLYQDGGMLYETMTSTEIDKVKNTYSKIPDSKAWKESWGEMAKKTVLRRLCKLIEKEFDDLEQNEAWEEGADAQFDDVTDLQPIEMPKAIEEPQEQPAEEEQTAEPPQEEVPSAKSVKDVLGNGVDGLFKLESQQKIVQMRNYCKTKNMSLDSISKFHLHKSVDSLNADELKILETKMLEEGKKIK